MATEWLKPNLQSYEIDVLDEVKRRDESLAKMFYGTIDLNIPENSIQYDWEQGVFNRWSEAVWNPTKVSVQGGGTGADNAAGARANLGANNASNLTTGTVGANRLSGTYDIDISGNAATADNADTVTYAFPSGTKMLFQQTSAPTGWVKDTTHNNKALRVVTGTAGSGGTNAFSTAFNSAITSSSGGSHAHTISVANHTLNTTRMPSHTHAMRGLASASVGSGAFENRAPHGTVLRTSGTGGGGSHNHSASSGATGEHTHLTNLDVQYVDLIIATKQ